MATLLVALSVLWGAGWEEGGTVNGMAWPGYLSPRASGALNLSGSEHQGFQAP